MKQIIIKTNGCHDCPICDGERDDDLEKNVKTCYYTWEQVQEAYDKKEHHEKCPMQECE